MVNIFNLEEVIGVFIEIICSVKFGFGLIGWVILVENFFVWFFVEVVRGMVWFGIVVLLIEGSNWVIFVFIFYLGSIVLLKGRIRRLIKFRLII